MKSLFKKVCISSDHAGYNVKEKIKSYLVKNEISIIPLIFYFGAIFWTLGYDTIYGFQDIKDDEIIGVKSTSIKFKNDPKKFLYTCYRLFIFCLIIIGVLMKFNLFYYLFLIIIYKI